MNTTEEASNSFQDMRILLLTLVFAPDSVSTSVIMTEVAQDLQTLGHRITVLTTTPHYNKDPEALARQHLERKWAGFLYESDYNGIRVLHVKVAPKAERVAERVWDYAIFHLVSVLASLLLVGPQDIILTPSPPLTNGLEAWLLGHLKRVPYIYNVQEIYPDVAIRLGVLRMRWVIWLSERIEEFVYRGAKAIVVISKSFLHTLRTIKHVPEEKLHLIPNFVDVDFVSPRPQENDFRHRYALDNSFIVLYAGNIGLTQSFDTLVETAKRLKEKTDIRFVIVGDGARRPWLAEQLQNHQLPNVLLLPFLPRSQMPELYAASNVCLVPLKTGMAETTVPSKVYTIMAAARLVLAAVDADSELAWLVSDAVCGIQVPPDDSGALAEGILSVYTEPEKYRIYGGNGRRYVVEHYARDQIARQYHQLLSAVVAQKAKACQAE